MNRLIAGLMSGVVVTGLAVAVPATQAGAVTVGYNCGAGFALKVKVTGTGSVNTLEEPNEKFKATNVVFKIFNPFSSPMTVSNVVVTVADPPTVTFLNGSTTGVGWAFTHPGTSTDTYAGTTTIPSAGNLASGPMKLKYRDASTDPPGPGIVNWYGGAISLNIVSPPGYGAVTCTPIAPVPAFASVRDPV
jgi:hypothetical protein